MYRAKILPHDVLPAELGSMWWPGQDWVDRHTWTTPTQLDPKLLRTD